MALRLKGKAPAAGEVDRRYYMIDVQEGKRRERLSSGTRNLALAGKKEQQVLDAMRADITVPKADLVALVRGELRASSLAARRPSGPTFGDVGAHCADNHWSKLAGWRTTGPNYRMVLDFIGPNTPMERIDQATLDRLVEHFKVEGNGPGTINRKLSIVSKLFEYAILKLRHQLYVPLFPRQDGEHVREFTFDEGEFESMMAALLARDDRVRKVNTARPIKYDAHEYVRYFSVMFETGLRPTEARQLTWANIDFRSDTILVKHSVFEGTRTKNKKSRTVPMTERCRELLQELPRTTGKGPFCHLSYDRSIAHWKAAKEALGIDHPDCVPYATRHSAGTRLVESTEDIHQAKEWLGHSSINLTSKTYAHVRTGYLKKGAAALNARRSEYDAEKLTRDSEALDSVSSDGLSTRKPN